MRLFLAALSAAAIPLPVLTGSFAAAAPAPAEWTMRQGEGGSCAAAVGFHNGAGPSGYSGSVFIMRVSDLDHIIDAFSFSPEHAATLSATMLPGTVHQLRLVLTGNGTRLDLGPSRFVVSAPQYAPGTLTLTGVRDQKETVNFRRFATLQVYSGTTLIRSIDLQGSAPAFREQGKCIVLAMMRARGAG